MKDKKTRRVVIMGAAGRDFHNFNMLFRNNPALRVVAFTAAQIPAIEKRKFPKELAGKLYKKDIPIYSEEKLSHLIKKLDADTVVFAYSDVSNQQIMEKAALASSCGANFVILGPKSTMLKSKRPVISVCAVRTGAGKSPTTRKICRVLKENDIKPVLIRHPMPYGNLRKQEAQRFAALQDLDKHKCTIEEREEYEPHIREGTTVYAGVDYEKILRMAEREADVIVWDGGNNDYPFYRPDLHIVVADARRPGHEVSYYHGAVNVRMADVVIINKVKTAHSRKVEEIEQNVKKLNPKALVIKANMTKTADRPDLIKGKKVLVVEDGPTLTHGGLSIGAGYLAAMKYKARKVVDPRPYAIGSIKETFEKFRHLDKVLPATGYGSKQMTELKKTINRVPCDSVIVGTPVDLGRYLRINKPFVRVTYEIHMLGKPDISDIVEGFVRGRGMNKAEHRTTHLLRQRHKNKT